MVHLFRCAEEIRRLLLRQCVVHPDVLQILDEQNLDESPPFLDEELHLVKLADAAVDAVLRHLLKMDCYLGAVDAVLRHLLKMDCYLGAAQVLLALRHFRRRAVLIQFWRPRAWQLLLCWQLI